MVSKYIGDKLWEHLEHVSKICDQYFQKQLKDLLKQHLNQKQTNSQNIICFFSLLNQSIFYFWSCGSIPKFISIRSFIKSNETFQNVPQCLKNLPQQSKILKMPKLLQAQQVTN